MSAVARTQAAAAKQTGAAPTVHRRPVLREGVEAEERGADRLAEAVAGFRKPASGGMPLPNGNPFPGSPNTLRGPSALPPSSSVRAINSPGRPMDSRTRGFMEARFGHDFAKVRIHTEGPAGKAADAFGAQAFTAGSDIVFAPGMYRPDTRDGVRLLAHELAHVVQPAGESGPLPVRFKKKPADKPFYEEALDELEAQKKATQVKLVRTIYDPFGIVPVIEQFIEFLKAVDAGDVKAIPGLFISFRSSDTSKLGSFFPSDALNNTVITRLLLLGLGDWAGSYRRWALQHERETKSPSELSRGFRSEQFIWEQVLDQLTNQIPETGADAALKVLDALLLLFGQMRDEAVRLDKTEIEKDRKRRAEIARFSDLMLDHDVTISVYFDSLVRLLKQCFTAIQIAYQVVFDQAVQDLGAGRGSKYLDILKDRLDNRLRGLIDPKEDEKKVGAVTVQASRSEFKKGGGKHLDFFAKGKAAKKREAAIEFYDKEMIEWLAREMELTFARVFEIRREQINVLEQIYGLAKDQTGRLTAETQENAAAIAKLGKQGLRLESDDDWRRFLVEKYETAKANGAKPADAFTSVMRLLGTFLHTFTTHTPYDIDDFHDPYLTRQFPRTLTGQLIHDCGVYALRIAYMLSLLREHKDLQLRFRFITLPVHVGLIITSQSKKDIPTYFTHNDELIRWPPDYLADVRDAWIKTDEKGNPRTDAEAAGGASATGAQGSKGAGAQPGQAAALSQKDEDQFLAELAGTAFIPGVELPFKLIEVPKPRGGPDTIKTDLWKTYTTQVAPTRLFGPETENPKSPVYQFHLKYLQVLEMIKKHFNESLLPFWNNIAFPAWQKHEPVLTKALAELNGAKTDDERTKKQSAYDDAVKKYFEDVQPPFNAVEAAFSPITAAQVEIEMTLRDHPEALAKNIGVVHAARVEAVIRMPWWSREIYDHFSEVGGRRQVQAPFARREDLLWPID